MLSDTKSKEVFRLSSIFRIPRTLLLELVWVCNVIEFRLPEASGFANTLQDYDICLTFVSDSAACGGVANALCTDTGVNSRSCECAPGYSGAPKINGFGDNENFYSGTCTGKAKNCFSNLLILI